jgi:general nucleoside transport system permease protein
VNGLLTQSFLTALVAGGIVAAIPLMFTALGESVSERSGVLNIGLEGMMLLGAYMGFLGAYELHSMWLGFLAGMAGGLVGSVVMVVLSVAMGLDQIVVGIAITIAGEGVTSVLQQAQFKGTFPGLGNPATVAIPGLSDIPVLGHSVFDQPLLVYLGIGLLVLVSWVFRSTAWGLNLRAAGEKPEALDAAGVSVLAVRTYAVATTGALAGLGGAYLSIVGAGTFTPFMTQGQGFMAIVIAMLASHCGLAFPPWSSACACRSAPRSSSPASTSPPTSSTCCHSSPSWRRSSCSPGGLTSLQHCACPT